MAGELMTWLRSIGPDRLARLLERRPDAASAPEPATLGELAQRLAQRPSVLAALAQVDAPTLQLTEVLAALVPVRRDALSAALPDVPAAELDRLLDGLQDLALAWDAPTPDGPVVRAAGGLSALWPQPLGLAEPLRPLLGRLQPGTLDVVLRTLGVSRTGSRSNQHGAVVAHLTPKRIRALVASAPEPARRLLDAALVHGPALDLDPEWAFRVHYLDRYADAGEVGWTVSHALMLPLGYDTIVMPREVATALRGGPPTLRISLDRPGVVLAAADPAGVARTGAAAVVGWLDLVTAVVEQAATAPPPTLKSGGVGVREVRRLARLAARDEEDVALALEVAGGAGLVVAGSSGLVATEAYDTWRDAPPADRSATLVAAWWRAPFPMGVRTDPATGKQLAPLTRAGAQEEVRRLRQLLLRTAASLPNGSGVGDVDSLVEHARWARPMAYPPVPQAGELGAAAWHEAELLGLVAFGALTELGRAVVRDAPDSGWQEGLVEAAAAVLPDAATTVTLQADLTAMVGGPPSASLVELLDSAADREARGGASIWRFSATSVRRHLDAGGDVDDLLARLTDAAPRGVPQPLEYLLRDVARRHGHVQVAPVSSCVVSDDVALLAEIAATRSLKALGLRLLAPTVLASTKHVRETVDELRAAGYAPLAVRGDGTAVVERTARIRAAPDHRVGERSPLREAVGPRRSAPAAPEPLDPAAMAKRLLAASDAPAEAPADDVRASSAAVIREHARQLGLHEVAVLAHAVDHDGAVLVEYQNSGGTLSERVLSSLDLLPPFLLAYCHLRQDERTFSLDRLQAVSPA